MAYCLASFDRNTGRGSGRGIIEPFWWSLLLHRDLFGIREAALLIAHTHEYV